MSSKYDQRSATYSTRVTARHIQVSVVDCTILKYSVFFIFQSLRLRILLICLHIIVIIIIIPYSEWTALAAREQPPVRTEPWAAVLVHATRLVRNLSSAGTRSRQELRDEKDLVDCLVWITRVGVKNEQYDNKVSLIT